MARFGLQVGGIKTWIAEALFPRFCVSCQAEGSILCRACHAKWRSVPIAHENMFAFFAYADPVARGLLQAWKYGFDESAWRILRKEVEEKIPHLRVWFKGHEADALVPVPLFYIRRNERGFDQAEELAQQFSAMLNIP